MAGEPLLRRLARWSQDLGLDRLPPEVIEKTKLLILDSLGCAIAALDHPSVTPVREAVSIFGDLQAATVVGGAKRAPITSAILVNGTLIRALDFNDFYWSASGGGGHPSDNIAAALAVAEAEQADGASLIAATVVGYEIYCRVANLMDTAAPWDHVGSSGLAAAGIAGRLLKLDLERFTQALALGATYAHPLAALRQGAICTAKAASNALVAGDGVLGAYLAKAGMTGPVEALEGPFGLPAVLAGGADLARIVPLAEDDFLLMDVAFKAFPCIGTAQAAIAAALELRKRIPDPADIRAIEIMLPDAPVIRTQSKESYRRPTNRETADHSFYFLIAAALVDGEVAPRQFRRHRWADAVIVEAMDRITMVRNATLETVSGFPSTVVVQLASGERIESHVQYAPGTPINPMTADDVARKFMSASADGLDADKAEQVVDLVMGLERLEKLDSLLGLVAQARAR